jgi:hypothetical protein
MKPLRQAVLAAVALTVLWSLASEPSAAAPKAAKKTPEKAPSGIASARDAASVAANLDRLADERLAAAKLKASPLADDGEFIRRLSLDLRGRVPAAERVASFLADTDPDKRAKLIDEFLADPEYGEHFAIIWYHRMVKPDDDNRLLVAGNKFQDWLADHFNQNVGWDKIVTAILTVNGDRDSHPQATFWLNNVGDAKSGQPEPNKITAAASRLFLGVRLECCECHNHPFSTLKQTDFWGTAAFFAQTHSENSSKKDAKNDKVPIVHEGGVHKERKKDAEHKAQPFGSIEIPYAKGKTVKATYLGGDTPSVAGQSALRPVFTNWLTSAKNPFFSRAAVNKLWANFFSRGIVDPVDDMRAENEKKATHPEVLSMLADEFAASGFDLKNLVRCICLSKTYQRTSRPLPENKEDDTLLSHMPLKVMSADMLYDSLSVVLGHKATEPKEDKGAGKKKKGYGGPREAFRKLFHAEADDDSGVVEDYTHGIPQVLKLLNSKQVNDTSAAVAKVMQTGSSPEKVIEGLYLTALARRPTDAELQRIQKYMAGEKDATKGYRDVLWALINSNEFLFNH